MLPEYLQVQNRTDKISCCKWLPYLTACAACVVSFLLIQDSTVGISFRFGIYAFNILYLFGICLLGSAVTGSMCAGVVLMLFVSGTVSVVNQYLLRFRGQILSPWDLTVWKTAVSVLRQYDLTPDRGIKTTVVLYLLLGAGVWKLLENFADGQKRLVRGLAAAVLLLGIPLLVTGTGWLPVNEFPFHRSVNASRDGIFLDFFCQMKSIQRTAPEGYEKEQAEVLLSSYREDEKEPEELPTIIAVMCEAFSDPSVLGEVKTDRDYLPNLRAIMNGKENTVSGTLYTSVLGGGTVWTEYEFLSGNTRYFEPDAGYPYDRIRKGVTDTSYMLPSYLKGIGYETCAIHPYSGENYNRNNAYEAMGFDRVLFQENFKDPEYVRDFISDRSLFKRITEECDEADGPLFCFAVTVQNHGFYSDEDPVYQDHIRKGESYQETFELSGSRIRVEGENDAPLETYLTLESMTDQELNDLVRFVDQMERPAVLLFFGDHQPSPYVTEPVSGLLSSADSRTGKEDPRFYQVPFFLHANYPVESEHGVEVSANYLQSLLLPVCGLSGNTYQRFLEEMRNGVPVLSMTCQKGLTDSGLLSGYRNIQYYLEDEKEH